MTNKFANWPQAPGQDEFCFLPLGGAGEIGMNLNLYGHAGSWLMVDLGIAFGDETLPGIELVMPDPAFIVERRERLAGLVLTHAHEDHIGAVPYLWPSLKCPIYATAFTAAVVRRKLKDAGVTEAVDIVEVPLSGRFAVGPFELELITLTHSIPEPNAVVIRTPLGAVLHTGDWKLDPEPLIGDSYDEAALRRLADEPVLAMVCDSTNALVEGETGSESEVRQSLMELVGRFEHRVVMACFATNVARLQSMAKVAEAHDRHVALVGRSLWRIYGAAQDTGYLTDIPPFVSEHDVGYLPRRNVMLICTGSQGEPRSALARIARQDHPQVTLDPGDAVVFSSRIIPGNEKAIFSLQNDLVRLGLDVVTERDHFVHVSGHPARDELARMYQWVRPQAAIPVHGEMRHLVEHARLAQACQVPHAIVGENGAFVRLAPSPVEIVGRVPSGRLALDGARLLAVDSPVLRTRQRMKYSGSAVATVLLDRKGNLRGDPRLAVQGVVDMTDGAEDLAEAVEAIRAAVTQIRPASRDDDDAIGEAVRLAVRRAFFKRLGKKPVTEVQLMRV